MGVFMDWGKVAEAVVPEGRLVRVRPLSGGISAQMTALEIVGPDGETQRVVVRRGPALEKQFRLLSLTHAQGLATPRPLVFDAGGAVLSEPFLALTFQAGEMTFVLPDRATAMQQAAAQLAAIHSIDAAQVDFSFLPLHENEHSPAGATALETRHIRGALAKMGPPPQNGATLLHGDFWPGNWLWQDGRLAGVIDWEDAALGDPLVDLAISRLEVSWIYGREALDQFTRAYQALMPLDYTALPYWDLRAALRLARLVGDDLAGWARFFGPYGREDIMAEGLRGDFEWFVGRALAGPVRPEG